MKKAPILVIIIALLLLVGGVTLYKVIKIDIATKKLSLVETTDQATFKKELEILNLEKKEDGTNKYIQISIPENNKMKYATFEEVTSLLKEGTGIIYFGFPTCPWCRRILPVFFDTIKDYDIDQIYYYNARDLRDTKKLDENGNIIVEKEGDPKYYELLNLLGDNLGEYEGLNNPSIKRLYFPTFVFIKDGEILGLQVSSVDSYKSTTDDMTEVQKTELSSIFKNYIEQIYNKLYCDEETSTAC